MKFDVIIGNPPFNGELWMYLYQSAFSKLKKNGYMYIISPQIWRKPNHPFFQFMKQYNLKYLKMLDRKASINYFGKNVYISVDISILQKCDYEGSTKIIDYNNVEYNLNLQKYDFIPNKYLDFIYNELVEKNEEEKTKLYTSSYFSYNKCCKEPDDRYKYVVMNVVHKSKHGISNHNVIYSDIKHDALYFPKIILSDMIRQNVAFNDYEGKYLISPHSFAFEIKSFEMGEKYKKIISENNFREILAAITWSNSQIDPTVFSYFNKDFLNIIDKKLK